MAKITAYDALTEVASGDIIPIVDVSDTTMGVDGTNKKVTRATLLRDNLYGWTPAESTWTYASATTFTIAGVDRTNEYRKGGKIRWKQGGAYKYAYILSSAFSTDTTVTITGGSDYTIANSAITDNYVSYEVSPLGFPDWFAWAPVMARNTGTGTSLTASDTYFNIVGGVANFIGVFINVNNDGASTHGFNGTLPVTVSQLRGGAAADTGAVVEGASVGLTGGNIYISYKTTVNSTWFSSFVASGIIS
jgi:hypothetical protein